MVRGEALKRWLIFCFAFKINPRIHFLFFEEETTKKLTFYCRFATPDTGTLLPLPHPLPPSFPPLLFPRSPSKKWTSSAATVPTRTPTIPPLLPPPCLLLLLLPLLSKPSSLPPPPPPERPRRRRRESSSWERCCRRRSSWLSRRAQLGATTMTTKEVKAEGERRGRERGGAGEGSGIC